MILKVLSSKTCCFVKGHFLLNCFHVNVTFDERSTLVQIMTLVVLRQQPLPGSVLSHMALLGQNELIISWMFVWKRDVHIWYGCYRAPTTVQWMPNWVTGTLACLLCFKQRQILGQSCELDDTYCGRNRGPKSHSKCLRGHINFTGA